VTRTAFVNARLIDPATRLDAPGALLVEGERIADLGPDLFADGVPDGIELIDCSGHCLAPGLVDMRVQLREPGEEHKETIETASRAAAAGGVTAMVCLPNTHPPIDDVAVVEFVARRAREVKHVKIFAYGAVTRGLAGEQLTEIGLLHEAGAVGFTDGLRAVANARVMRRALSYARGFGALIVQHPEEPSLARDGAMNEGETATRLGLAGIPPIAEAIMVERDVRLAALTGGRVHFAHVSTEAALDVIRRAKRAGLAVSCDTAPPYFTLNETAVGDYRTFAKLSPPLRDELDRRAVIDALGDGTIVEISLDLGVV
jgi:dihydroorotase